MAGGQERALRRRIKAIQSTKKITRAMELIASSQIVRAQNRIRASAPYEQAVTAVAHEMAKDLGEHAGRFIGAVDEPQKVLLLGLVADRGLCGGYNANVLRSIDRTVRAGKTKGIEYRIITSGKKAPGYLRYRGLDVEQSFTGMSDRPKFEDARSIALAVTVPFIDEEVDQVLCVSTRFLSSATQVVETRQLLPLPIGITPDQEDLDERPHFTEDKAPAAGYTEFEPDSSELIGELVSRYVEASVFQAMLEAAASEHTARQRAMAAATENADELTKTLTRVMNRARQDAITTEIMEIVSGAEALRQGPEEE
ncbi:MAG: ATP synthase F1 subunit gamma [Acidimicrobiales bacterium]|jgi:F-type H+-transporting ATPase subunit gamma